MHHVILQVDNSCIQVSIENFLNYKVVTLGKTFLTL